MSKKYLGKDLILGAQLKTKEVEVPEWGGSLLISESSLATMQEISDLRTEDKSASEISAFWFVLHVVDEDGERVFSKDDIPALLGKSSEVLQRVTREIIDFSSPPKVDNGKEDSG